MKNKVKGINVPKYNGFVNKEKPSNYSDYKSLEIQFGDSGRYEIGELIGNGAHSDVYLGLDK